MGTTRQRAVALLLAFVLFINTANVDGKRLFGGSSRKTSGSRTHSSTGSRTHVSSPHKSHSSNGEATRLSYAPSHSSIGSTSYGNRGNSFGTNTHHQPSAPHATVAPIGWNVPKNQGPPPAYSPVNPVGGARTNLHESPPSYRPNTGTVHSPSAPPYPGASNSNTKPFTPAQNYRPRYNSTGGLGGFGSSSNVHTPISASSSGHGLQSSYPRQQLPAGSTYYPAGSSLPAGATYHPSGSIPHGASYHPSGGNIPHGATYYPSNSHLPPGATYHPAGQIPPGAHYYPSSGIPAAAHYPAAPPGATYLPAGAALPAGAVYYAQPPKSSSGLGFGSGLAAGALGGAILGHALTPSRTTSYVQPSYNPGSSQGNDDKIIIINNGPPGSVSTTNAADGVTVINAGQQQAQPAQPSQTYQPSQPLQPAQQPVQPAGQPAAPLSPVAPPPVSQPNSAVPNAAGTPPTNTAEQSPQPGSIICVPVRVPQPDPNDATKTIEVEQIACYPAPPPEVPTNSTVVPTADNAAQITPTASPSSTTSTTQAAGTTTKDGVTLASFQSTSVPVVPSEGIVPLAPLNPSAGQPDFMRMPGEPTLQHHSSSQVMLAPESNLHVANSAAGKYFNSFAFTSLLALMLAYCLH